MITFRMEESQDHSVLTIPDVPNSVEITSEISGPEMISECDTESFEDIGPSSALKIGQHEQNSVHITTNKTIPTSILDPLQIPPQLAMDSPQNVPSTAPTQNNPPDKPVETNISAISVTSPYISPNSMIQRRVTEDTSRFVYLHILQFMLFKLYTLSKTTDLALTSTNKMELAEQLWITGKDKAQKWAKLYGNIDTMRPYFDVEPRTIANRIVQSFIPITDLSSPEKGDFALKTVNSMYYFSPIRALRSLDDCIDISSRITNEYEDFKDVTGRSNIDRNCVDCLLRLLGCIQLIYLRRCLHLLYLYKYHSGMLLYFFKDNMLIYFLDYLSCRIRYMQSRIGFFPL